VRVDPACGLDRAASVRVAQRGRRALHVGDDPRAARGEPEAYFVKPEVGALLAELNSGRLRAALDVTDPEPLPDGHPLWQAPGLLLTPHVGGAVHGSRERAFRVVSQQLARLAAGEPLGNIISHDGY